METEVSPAAEKGPPLPADLDLPVVARTSPLPTALCASDRPDLPIVWANAALTSLLGTTEAGLVGRAWTSLAPPDCAPAFADAEAAQTARVVDATLARTGAAPVPCRLYVTPIPDRGLLLVQAVELGADLAPGADTLLRDLRHRVMNHLQFIQSVLHMQSLRMDSEPTREALRDIGARIDTLAVVYRQLYASRTDSRIELAGYLAQLVSNLSAFYDRDGRVRLVVDAPDADLLVPVERAFPLGLIVTELVVNSFKHAFQGRPGGNIAIAVSRTGAGTAEVTVADDGPGLPAVQRAGAGKRLGLTLIRSLAAQVGGTVTMSSDRGARFVIALPLDP